MPTPTKGPRLGGGPAHERLILANLATQLFEHRSITTTAAKAKRVRPLAERLVTMAKRGDLASRRRVMTVVRDKSVVHFLFTEIAPAMAERPGGYTRITKIGNRKGDNAPMAVIELVMEPVSAKQATVAEAEGATRRAAKKTTAKKAAAPVVTAEDDAEVLEEAQTIVDVANEDEAAAEASLVETAQAIADQAADEEDAVVEGPYGPGSAEPPADGSIPAGFPVKGNKDSMKYHTESSQWYDKTVAEVYFRTAQDAADAGFEQAGKPKSS